MFLTGARPAPIAPPQRRYRAVRLAACMPTLDHNLLDFGRWELGAATSGWRDCIDPAWIGVGRVRIEMTASRPARATPTIATQSRSLPLPDAPKTDIITAWQPPAAASDRIISQKSHPEVVGIHADENRRQALSWVASKKARSGRRRNSRGSSGGPERAHGRTLPANRFLTGALQALPLRFADQHGGAHDRTSSYDHNVRGRAFG